MFDQHAKALPGVKGEVETAQWASKHCNTNKTSPIVHKLLLDSIPCSDTLASSAFAGAIVALKSAILSGRIGGHRAM